MQTLLELEITPKYREDIIMQLETNDYVDGPIEDTLNKKRRYVGVWQRHKRQ